MAIVTLLHAIYYVNFIYAAVIFPSEIFSLELPVGIVDDTLPELDEVFLVRLASVELLGMPEPGSVAPTLGTNREVQITILASDGPFGTFSLVQGQYSVSEGVTLAIPIVREGGRLGDITVMYAFTAGRASPADYTEQGTTAVFVEGQATAEVIVSIVQDSQPETVEDFTFSLLGVTRATWETSPWQPFSSPPATLRLALLVSHRHLTWVWS